MFIRTKISSYEAFQSDLYADRGRALSPRELELFEDAPLPVLLPMAPRRRAPLPRWRPPALAAETPVIASLEFEAVNGMRSVS